jgi:ATP-dependent exoDNAse (exonuclease V) alpha subunit
MIDGMVRVTNTAQVRIEEKVMDRARAAARDRSGALTMLAIREAITGAGVPFTAEQRAAIHALGQGGRLTLLTGVAGAGKTTLLQPLVEAWHSDRRFAAHGREVVGAAMAWRQADALKDADIRETYALSPLLAMIEKGQFKASRNTVLVIDEVSQIGPRPMLKLLELQAKTGMTIKMLGDREQAQAIEAGDSIELFARALPPEALPELLTTQRQSTQRAREIAGLFREGKAADALIMKRADGHAMLAGGDREQVVAQIADLYIARRDILIGSGSVRGITVSAPTNDDAAEISQAIRERLKARGEIHGEEWVHRAVDQRGQEYDLALALGDRVRLFRRTWGTIDGREQQVGNNGDVVTVIAQHDGGIRIRTKDGQIADVEWRRFADVETGRLLLGLGHALTIDAAQGLTSDEHINALPRGTSGVSAFTSYVAESRARGITWTVISEGALHEAERHRQALGDSTPITIEDLWARAGEDMSDKPYKSLGIDLLASALHDREQAIDTFIACSRHMESAKLDDGQAGPKAFQRLRAAAVNESLGRHLTGLDHAIGQNGALIRDLERARETTVHLRTLRAQAVTTAKQLGAASANIDPSRWPGGGLAP